MNATAARNGQECRAPRARVSRCAALVLPRRGRHPRPDLWMGPAGQGAWRADATAPHL